MVRVLKKVKRVGVELDLTTTETTRDNFVDNQAVFHNSQTASLLSDSGLVMYFKEVQKASAGNDRGGK